MLSPLLISFVVSMIKFLEWESIYHKNRWSGQKSGQSKKLTVRREYEFGIEVDVVGNREHKSGHQPPSKYAMLRI